MDALRVAFIGLAHLHPLQYLKLIEQLDELVLTAAAEKDTALLKRFTDAAGCAGFRDYRELLERDDVDCVFIFLPHSECPEVAAAAAQAGKHIVVEKPCAASPDGVREIAAAAEQAGVSFTAPYCWRYSAAARTIRELIMEGALGEVCALEGRCAAGRPERYRRAGAGWMLEKAKSGGGPMFNLGVHWIDLFRWLLADEVVRVAGAVSCHTRGIDVEDCALALLTFRSGALATLDISYSVPESYPQGRDLFVALRGTQGALSWKPGWLGAPDELFLCSEAPNYASAPVRRICFDDPGVAGYAGAMGLEFLRELAQCIAAGVPPPISGDDAFRAAQVAWAVYQSAETGRAVELPPD